MLPSLAKVKAYARPAVKENVVTCEVCKYAMSYLEGMLVENSTEEDVKKALDSLCEKLPASLSGEVIDFYFPYFCFVIHFIFFINLLFKCKAFNVQQVDTEQVI